jgi:hypothetical protein
VVVPNPELDERVRGVERTMKERTVRRVHARTGNEPDNNYADTPATTQIGRLFHLSSP